MAVWSCLRRLGNPSLLTWVALTTIIGTEWFARPPYRVSFKSVPRYHTKGCSRYWTPKNRSWTWLRFCKNQCSCFQAVSGLVWTPFCVILRGWLISDRFFAPWSTPTPKTRQTQSTVWVLLARNLDHGLSFSFSRKTQSLAWSEFCSDHGLSFVPRSEKHWGRGRRMSSELSHFWRILPGISWKMFLGNFSATEMRRQNLVAKSASNENQLKIHCVKVGPPPPKKNRGSCRTKALGGTFQGVQHEPLFGN